jgi:hypothetical protein
MRGTQRGGSAGDAATASNSQPERFHWRRWSEISFKPIDIASLVIFRITFGGLMMWEVCRYLRGKRVDSLWIDPEFHFKYYGFEWVHPPPDDWMYGLMACLLVSAAGITLGLWYRLCAFIFAVGFTWLFLIDQAKYLNHFYLICLLAFISAFLPANRRLAIDCLRKPALRSDIAPAWTLWLLRAQMSIVYFYGGLAKLNADWLRGEPVRDWLHEIAAHSATGAWLATEWMVWVISYGGLLFDLFIVPLLFWRKTRVMAFVLAMAFHLTNHWLFDIGIFPWLSIATTALFFSPDWPRQFGARIRELWMGPTQVKRAPLLNANQVGFKYQGVIAGCLSIYLSWQLLMPLRHFLYPGAVSWTEEGHRFSWHMKLRSKKAQTRFFVLDPNTTEVWELDPLAYLAARQYQKMNGHPDMILQFAHHIAELMRKTGRPNIHVHVIARAELNGRPPALLIDPDVNLAAIPRNLQPAKWILPLGNTRPSPEWLTSAPASSAEGSISR